jgi:predicted DNA-binding transcriptional regulator AlpA
MDRYFTEKELSQQLSVALQTIRNWRCVRRGPNYHKFNGRLVRYSEADVIAWLEGRRIDLTPQVGKGVSA